MSFLLPSVVFQRHSLRRQRAGYVAHRRSVARDIVDDDLVLLAQRSRTSSGRSPSAISLEAYLRAEISAMIPMDRRFWSLHPPPPPPWGRPRNVGTLSQWNLGASCRGKHPDVLERKFIERYRVNLPTFNRMSEKFCEQLSKQDTSHEKCNQSEEEACYILALDGPRWRVPQPGDRV